MTWNILYRFYIKTPYVALICKLYLKWERQKTFCLNIWFIFSSTSLKYQLSVLKQQKWSCYFLKSIHFFVFEHWCGLGNDRSHYTQTFTKTLKGCLSFFPTCLFFMTRNIKKGWRKKCLILLFSYIFHTFTCKLSQPSSTFQQGGI